MNLLPVKPLIKYITKYAKWDLKEVDLPFTNTTST